MVKLYIDSVKTLSQTERMGIVRSLTRKVIVRFDFGDLISLDFSLLEEAMGFLPASMTPFSDLTPNTDPTFVLSQYDNYNALILVERNADLVDEDTGTVGVILKYEHLMDAPGQTLVAPAKGVLYGKGRCSIAEKTTNFFYPFGNRTGPRVQILTAHTFPRNDSGIVNSTLDPTLPMTVIQGGEVTIPYPQANYHIEGWIFTNTPWTVVNQLITKINSQPWLGMPAWTWLCSEVSFEIIDPTGRPMPLYKFGIEFQHNSDTWNPTVAFQDQRTGRPPVGVLEANIQDNNGVVRLVNNPILAARVAVNPDPAREGAAAGANAGRELAVHALDAASFSLITGQPINQTALSDSSDSVDEEQDLAFSIGAQLSNQPPPVDPATLPGGAQGRATGTAAGFGAAQLAIAAYDQNLVALLDAGTIAQINNDGGTAGGFRGSAAGALAVSRTVNLRQQPAGVWTVPALQPVDFQVLFQTLFEV